MQLKKQPETEVEYWEGIEALGGFIWHTEHDLSHGRMEDKDGSIGREIEGARHIVEQLVDDIGHKYGIIAPNDCPKAEVDKPVPPAPEGKKYYWDWYRQMKNAVYSEEYNNIICSACPFSQGLQQMVNFGGSIPCGIFPGMQYRLLQPHRCGMLSLREWSEQMLHKKIIEEAGLDALAKFKKKFEELKTKPAQ